MHLSKSVTAVCEEPGIYKRVRAVLAARESGACARGGRPQGIGSAPLHPVLSLTEGGWERKGGSRRAMGER